MKLNTQRLLETCIEDGIKDAINSLDLYSVTPDKVKSTVSEYIWLQLDYYFNFEEQNETIHPF